MAHSNWTLFRERCRIFATKRESESAMLRVLHLDNWKSFSEPVDFTMIAGKETRHGETLYLGSKNRVLPVDVIREAQGEGKAGLAHARRHR